MAETVVVQPGNQDTSGAAWIALAIIVVALIVGGIYVYRHNGARASTSGGTNINVTLPTSGSSNTSGQ